MYNEVFTFRYFRGSSVCVLVYSVIDRNSFESVEELFRRVKANSDAKIILVSTFNDRPKEQHVVTSLEGQTIASKHKVHFVEVSSKTGDRMLMLRKLIVEQVLEYFSEHYVEQKAVLCD